MKPDKFTFLSLFASGNPDIFSGGEESELLTQHSFHFPPISCTAKYFHFFDFLAGIFKCFIEYMKHDTCL
jgi:hypothetical protein